MRRSRSLPFPLMLTLLLIPVAVAGQRLEPGTWTGTVTPPGEQTVNATFDVRVNGDSVGITLKVQFGDFPLSEIKVGADRVEFTFSPGTRVRCTLLKRENGSYSGDCLDANGEVGVIVMTPPGKSQDAAPRRAPPPASLR